MKTTVMDAVMGHGEIGGYLKLTDSVLQELEAEGSKVKDLHFACIITDLPTDT